jgi:peptidoglycan hydrolase CwlO-like protein
MLNSYGKKHQKLAELKTELNIKIQELEVECSELFDKIEHLDKNKGQLNKEFDEEK